MTLLLSASWGKLFLMDGLIFGWIILILMKRFHFSEGGVVWWVALIGHFVPCLVVSVSTLMRGIHVCDRYLVPFASLGF